MSVMVKVSITVLTGVSDQESNDFWMIMPDSTNPVMTTRIQKSLANLRVVEICTRPFIVEDLRNEFTKNIFSSFL